MEAYIGFSMAYLYLTLADSKGQGQSQFDCEKFKTESRCISLYVSVYAALSCYLHLSSVCKYVYHAFFILVWFLYLSLKMNF